MRGDGSQRALMAWHMGWDSATRASGKDWIVLYLATQRSPGDVAHRRIRAFQQVAGPAGALLLLLAVFMIARSATARPKKANNSDPALRE